MKERISILYDNKMSPTKIILLSFIYVILLGTCLLSLPIASKDGIGIGFLDALFTATSATCVTGLVVVDTFTQWTLFGQIVILCLIQIGGLGLVTLTTFLTVVAGKKLGFKTMQLVQESISFNNFFDIIRTVKKIMLFSLLIEGLGALALSTVFIPEQGIQGIFTSIFLSISAFCNAGFDILGFRNPYDSLSYYYNNPVVIFTISLLIIVGGLGFLVWSDIYNYKKTKKLLLHTKIVLIVTGILIVVGTILIFFLEYSNTLQEFQLKEKIWNSFFQSVSTRTAGFNTIPIDQMNGLTKVVFIMMMFIGASPGSTGGGIKVTTMGIIVMTIICVIQGKINTIVLKRKVSKQVVYKSFSILFVGIFIIFSTFLVMYYCSTTQNSAIDCFFEATSAFATVGLSSGVTETLGGVGKIATIITMFIGRVGTLSIFIAMFNKQSQREGQATAIHPDGLVIVG